MPNRPTNNQMNVINSLDVALVSPLNMEYITINSIINNQNEDTHHHNIQDNLI
ncbi:hypothetical protein [Staphylococcus pasteuri]|uniref:Uncharacterized protein n=2 Tax=Staphylococcus TaxID=1279 RepID=A0AAW7YNG8_9STAP|nr:hypothetical protein [Staphylococcus pasteuri]MDO6573696.1 hypothetical protein [Staphylococcus pasteuri_A]KKI55803.1 hypothetical protein UF70_2242 [Staphylococcus pasteuri]MCE3022786.1 hypothetical protein [Staphylococcus pasteuri]MCF7599578.1 hypothetical protein [Staphylococcus pasteuri]MDI3232031.1 hypothetical protein [Staphylococcus pasteuri]